MSRINGTDRPLPQLEADVSLRVYSDLYFTNWLVECERLLAEEEDAQPKAEIVRQPNGDAYTSNPML